MKRLILSLSVLFLGIAPSGFADPVTLTSGSMILTGDFSPGGIDIFGTDFAASGTGTGMGFNTVLNVGQTADLSRSFSMRPGAADEGSMTFGGQTQPGFVFGTFQMTTTPFVVPDPHSTVGVSTTLQTGFSLTGTVQLLSRLADSQPLFTQDVTGTGILTFGAENIGDGQLFAREGASLGFTPATASTPEPASMLLLGTGLAAVWQSRRLRRPN